MINRHLIQPSSAFCFDRDKSQLERWLGGHIMMFSLSDDINYPNVEHESGGEDNSVDGLITRTHNYGYDDYRARTSGKPMTLRTYRNPHHCGGSHSRVTVIAKISRRIPPPKHILTGLTVR